MSVPADAAAWPGREASVGTPRSGLLVDEAAFTAAFREHYGACLRLARRIVRDEGLAHEVVQEVFLAWWGAAGDGYRADRGGLAAWLSTITHHKAVDAVRTSERQRRLLAAAVSQVQHQPRQQLVDELVWWELGRQSLTAALSTLTPAQQEVLGLAYGTGLTQAEIAERLGIPLGTVKSRTHAGMLRLRAAIGGTWTPTGPTVQPEDVPTRLSKLAQQDRERHGGPTRVSTGTAHADVEVCAAALVRLASEEGPDRLRSAAMVRRAAALVDEHGEAGTYGLLLALARLAAASAASSPPAASTWTADQP